MTATRVVVVAGGHGTRLWPLSTRARPKQFVDFTGDGPLLATAVARARTLAGRDGVLVVAPSEQAALVREAVPDLPERDFLAEPAKRGTAAAIAFAAATLEARGEVDVSLVALPSDHHVPDADAQLSTLARVAALAAGGRLALVGFRPEHASASYGYVALGARIAGAGPAAHEVAAFVEKPAVERAAALVKDGRHLWNGGVLAGTPGRLLAAIAAAPGLGGNVEALRAAVASGSAAALARAYAAFPESAIEPLVHERLPVPMAVVESQYARVDLGDLASLAAVLPADAAANATRGDVFALASARNVATTSAQPVALVGVEGLAVVVTRDVVLVCRKDATPKLRDLVQRIAAAGRDDLL